MADSKWPPEAAKEKQNEAEDRPERNQVTSYKSFSLPALVKMMDRVVENSCMRACQLLCCSIDSQLFNRLTACPGQKEQGHSEEQHSAEVASSWSPPSTILIVNISNSTLVDCVIGNESRPPAVTEKQPLMQGNIQDLHDPKRCSCSPASHAPSIQIDRSNLSCVIIGHNNYMQVEQTVPSEEEAEEDCKDES